MSWSRHGRGGRRGYHHGNLREALIGAALDLISQKGPAGFTFAEAARQAGKVAGLVTVLGFAVAAGLSSVS